MPEDDHKEIRVTVELDGRKYGYRQYVPLDGSEDSETVRNYTAYAIASTIQNTIIEMWEDSMATKWTVEIDDDLYLLYRGDDLFFETDHDEVGWYGASMLEKLAVLLNEAGA